MVAQEENEWLPAAIMHPLPDRRLEFVTRDGPHIRRGLYVAQIFTDDDNGERVAEQDVLTWRYA